MLMLLEIVSVVLVAVAMGLSLAHALEFPGKLRLEEETYLAVQTIYYPGFTIGGISEPLAVIATLALLIVTPKGTRFGLVLISFVAMLASQGVFWLVTQPANRFWLRHARLSAAGTKFFSVDKARQTADQPSEAGDWKSLRNRWEYSHVARAVLSGIGFLALLLAVVLQ